MTHTFRAKSALYSLIQLTAQKTLSQLPSIGAPPKWRDQYRVRNIRWKSRDRLMCGHQTRANASLYCQSRGQVCGRRYASTTGEYFKH
ncbi:hypothetical protein [Paraglaciecola arctica]|uniref:hypothetical protein n=1 Tax=Paraglaciecola arctica TaxID=1128911 RepID=UPI00129A8CBB|nr:hypothetical protein [Paraglaciecola arctica]